MAGTIEANKKLVKECFQEIFVSNKYDDKTLLKYFSPNFIEHNPDLPDGIEGLKAFKDILTEVDVKRVIAEGDLVFTHSRFVIAGKGTVAADICRVENGKIVEHWDVLQDIPDKPTISKHPFF